jgi:hypothetical protein
MRLHGMVSGLRAFTEVTKLAVEALGKTDSVQKEYMM